MHDVALPQYNDKGPFEVEFKVGGYLLIFSMHSNVFEFDDKHPVWKTKYIEEDSLRSYCGVINIYNFLADSFDLCSNAFSGIEDFHFFAGDWHRGLLVA